MSHIINYVIDRGCGPPNYFRNVTSCFTLIVVEATDYLSVSISYGRRISFLSHNPMPVFEPYAASRIESAVASVTFVEGYICWASAFSRFFHSRFS